MSPKKVSCLENGQFFPLRQKAVNHSCPSLQGDEQEKII
jgi:hypothetical protein